MPLSSIAAPHPFSGSPRPSSTVPRIVRLALVQLLAWLAVGLAPALAEGRYSGPWSVTAGPDGPTIMTLSLFDTGSTISGEGQNVSAGGSNYAGGTVEVVAGQGQEGGMQLLLQLNAPTARIGPARARLAVNGGNGPFLSGVLVLSGEAPQSIAMSGEDGGVDGGASGGPVAASEGCTTLFSRMSDVRALPGYGPAIETRIEAELARNGIDPNGPFRDDACARAFAGIDSIARELAQNANAGGGDAVALCAAVDEVTTDIVRELENIGLLESGELDLIYTQSGLGGDGVRGERNARTCGAALPRLRDYLASLRTGGASAVDAGAGTPGGGRPYSCVTLEDRTAVYNAMPATGTRWVQEVRGIYTANGLAFGGEETDAKCAAALREVEAFAQQVQTAADAAGTGRNSAECQRVDRLFDNMLARLRQTGGDEGELNAIQLESGLGGDGDQPFLTIRANCAAAVPRLEAFLNGLGGSGSRNDGSGTIGGAGGVNGVAAVPSSCRRVEDLILAIEQLQEQVGFFGFGPMEETLDQYGLVANGGALVSFDEARCAGAAAALDAYYDDLARRGAAATGSETNPGGRRGRGQNDAIGG